MTTANFFYIVCVCSGKTSSDREKCSRLRNCQDVSFILQLSYFIHPNYISVPIYFNFTLSICFISKSVYYGFFFMALTHKRDEPVKRLKLNITQTKMSTRLMMRLLAKAEYSSQTTTSTKSSCFFIYIFDCF